MNFSQLEYFIRICESGSISRAAEQLYVTQSALSQQLSRMEKELGVLLFNRYGNSLVLTENGQRMLDSARNILFEYRNATTAFSDTKEHRSLTLAVTKTKSFITLTYLLPGFRQQYPDINIQIREVDSYQVEELLLHGEADLGFCSNSSDPDLAYHEVWHERILLAVPPAHRLCQNLQESDGLPLVSFEEIMNQPFVIGTSGYLSHYVQELFDSHSVPLHIAIETANPGFAHLLAAANVGLAFIGEISSWIVPQYIRPPRFFRLAGHENEFMQVTLAHHRRKYVTSSMRLFIDYARTHLRERGAGQITL